MSATDWTTCPRCKQRQIDAKTAMLTRARLEYGKISSHEYLALVEQATAPIERKETLRLDYCLGIDDDGAFEVHYEAVCTSCGFSHEFRHKEQTKL